MYRVFSMLTFRIGNLSAVDSIMMAREQHLTQCTQELQEIASNIESQAQAERNFFALMSHELRTPLNSIINMHRFLLEEQHLLSESHLEYIKTSFASAEALLSGMFQVKLLISFRYQQFVELCQVSNEGYSSL